MIDAVIIVLRETLEASLLIGFLFVYSNHFLINKTWLIGSLLVGSFLSLIVVIELPNISDLLDGIGQELLFFSVLLTLSVLIQWSGWQIILLKIIGRQVDSNQLKYLYSVIILLAVSLEGAEIIIYLQSRLSNESQSFPSILGGLLGLGIGLSVSALLYYLLSQTSRVGLWFCFVILTLVSAGMASQAYSYLMQADIVDSGYPIWDSNYLVDERSVLGQLFYALFGYEATPTSNQLFVYLAYVFFPFIVLFYFRRYKNHSNQVGVFNE